MDAKEKILENVRGIPALPTAASRIIVLLRDPDVDIGEITRTIEYDPSLTSNLLRLANSAYFAGPRRIASLRDAIMRLGMNRIFQLVIASAITPVASKAVKGYDLPPGRLLEHAIAVAIGAEEVARQLDKKAPPNAFTAGLLHDLGKIILGTFLEVDSAPITNVASQENVSFEVAEARVLGIDHAEVGAVLLEHWNLPSAIVEPVRWHHNPDAFAGDPFTVDLVHVADMLSLGSGIGAGIDGLHYRPAPGALSRLGVNTNHLEHVASQVLEKVQDLRNLVMS